MTRTTLLALFAATTAVQGFSPMTMPSTKVRLFASMDEDLPMDIIPEKKEDIKASSFAFDVVVEDDVLEEPVTSKPSIKSIKIPNVVDIDTADLKAKASSTFDDISTKAKEIVEDERIQEIASNAKDFANDVADKLFSAMGAKLKQLKKEREEMKTKSGRD